jgi:hypothetical protein
MRRQYFNIIHGKKIRRRFTTVDCGKPCQDYLLVARDIKLQGLGEEREIALFEMSPPNL